MTLSNTTAPQLAARAGRGDMHALETLLRDIAGYVANATAASIAKLQAITATAAQLNQYAAHRSIVDASAEASYYVVCDHAGTIDKITVVTDSAVLTADVTVTAKIATVAVTTGVVTCPVAGAAAGNVASCIPTAARTVTAGQVVELVVSGGGAAGTGPRLGVSLLIGR